MKCVDVVYGAFMTATGWKLALLVWASTLLSFMVASAVKIGTYWLLDHKTTAQARHLDRIEGRAA